MIYSIRTRGRRGTWPESEIAHPDPSDGALDKEWCAIAIALRRDDCPAASAVCCPLPRHTVTTAVTIGAAVVAGAFYLWKSRGRGYNKLNLVSPTPSDIDIAQSVEVRACR